MTNDFEKALANVGLIPKLAADGDKLGKFVSDVELHFASKKRDRIMARSRRLLVRADFNVFSVSGTVFLLVFLIFSLWLMETNGN
jgi:hypothetical protein